VRIPIASPPDAKRAADSARDVAASIGFSATECEEIVLAAIELASNLVKHAGGGTLTVAATAASDRPGIRIESEDAGPGILDLEQALTDGYSTAGSLGVGLGAVNRLMDELELRSLPTAGAHIVCYRWLRPGAALALPLWLDVGAATRACRRQMQNGDAFLVKQWGGDALMGVIDGLGHGQFAQRAAQTARYYIEQHYDLPLLDLFRGAGRACRATRGVVMALARFEGQARERIEIASLGDIGVRVVGGAAPINVLARRGVVGLGATSPLVTVRPWTPASILIMHSDGVGSHWRWEDFRDLAREPARRIARRLLSALGSGDDDATVLVVRSAEP
jgi:anti-sigma regulatory factor (Ser/Thr protein kinase)/serine/threonine protein phosphatase PrpC